MVVAPVTRRVETTGPDARTALARSRLLGPVATRGNGQPLRHHDGAKILAGNRAGGEEASILIGIFGPAIDGTGSQQCREAIACGAAARPGPAVCRIAILGQFRRIEAQQADPHIAQTEAVAIADPRLPRYRRRGLIEQRGEQPGAGQNDDCQDGTARTAEERKAIQLPTPDFTDR